MWLCPGVGLWNLLECWQRSLFPPQLCPRCVEPQESQNNCRGKSTQRWEKIGNEVGGGVAGGLRDKLRELVWREKKNRTKPNIEPLDMRSFPGVLEHEVNKA